MTDQNRPREWDDVDAGENTDHYTEYLETVTGAEAVRAYKRRSHRLLRPAEGDRLLDVGCGTGEDALMLAELVGTDGEVVGVDSSETMVEAARERGRDVPAVRFVSDDALDLSFPDKSFDAARADRVLQHLEAPAEALAELRRVTRPGGRVGISDPDWATALVDTPGGYSERFLSLEYSAPRTPTMGRQLNRLAREAGLVDIDIDTWTLTSTEFAFLNEAGELDAWTDAMQAAGETKATAVEEWFEGLRQADEQGELFGSITGFTIVGTVPERDE
jgi:ubiquinone/menaquinone biosynthesis C-methylase UbiE